MSGFGGVNPVRRNQVVLTGLNRLTELASVAATPVMTSAGYQGAVGSVVPSASSTSASFAWEVEILDNWTSNQNDFAFSNKTIQSIGANTDALQLTGVADGTDGRVVILWNHSTEESIVIKHESSSSVAANRIFLATGDDFTLDPDRWAFLTYDPYIHRWRLFDNGASVPDATHLLRGAVSLAAQNLGRGVKRVEELGFYDIPFGDGTPFIGPRVRWNPDLLLTTPYVAFGVVECYAAADHTNPSGYRPGLLAGASAFGGRIAITDRLGQEDMQSYAEMRYLHGVVTFGGVMTLYVHSGFDASEVASFSRSNDRIDLRLGDALGTPASYWANGQEGITGTFSPVGSLTFEGGLVVNATGGVTANNITTIRRARL